MNRFLTALFLLLSFILTLLILLADKAVKARLFLFVEALVGGVVMLILLAAGLAVFYLWRKLQTNAAKAGYIEPTENGDFGLLLVGGQWTNPNLPPEHWQLSDSDRLRAYLGWRLTTGKFGSPPRELAREVEATPQLVAGPVVDGSFEYLPDPSGSPVLMAVGREEATNDRNR